MARTAEAVADRRQAGLLTRRTLEFGAIGAAVASFGLFRAFDQSAEAANLRYEVPRSHDKQYAERTNIRWIRPSGSGNRSGTDRQNAAALADINAMIGAVGPGGTVYLLADADLYPTTRPIAI